MLVILIMFNFTCPFYSIFIIIAIIIYNSIAIEMQVKGANNFLRKGRFLFYLSSNSLSFPLYQIILPLPHPTFYIATQATFKDYVRLSHILHQSRISQKFQMHIICDKDWGTLWHKLVTKYDFCLEPCIKCDWLWNTLL